MLRFMRDYATSWFIKFILGAIVIVFIFWGVGNFGAQKQSRAAMVNEEFITMEEYNNAYRNLLERYRQNFGGNLNEEMLERLNIKQQALDGLIDQKLILQEAANLHFQVSEKELIDAVMKMEVFQTDGVFDKRRYTAVLRSNRLTPEEFEAIQRESMLEQKMRAFVFNSVRVSEQEAKVWYEWDNTTVSLEYVMFDPKTYEEIQPTEEEIRAFYEENKENYKTDPLIKVQFVRFLPESYTAQVNITEEAIKAYYEENQKEFETPKTVEARHILIKVGRESSPEEKAEKKEKALEILKMIREEGKDFAEMAKEYSEDPGSKERGGELGAFTKERMVKPFSDKAFSMNPGEISEPVLTQFGWHIIKVEKVNEASTLSFEDAKEKIVSKLTEKETKAIAYDKAETFHDLCYEGDDLAKIAKSEGLEPIITDFFTRKKGPEKEIKNRFKFASEAFKVDVKAFSTVQDFGDGYYILQPIEKIPEKNAEFEAVRADVSADLIQEKQEEKAKENAEAFLTALKNGESLAAESEKYDLTPKTTEHFKRTGAIPEIGYEKEISETAFKLSEEEPLPENVIKGRKGYYVIRFKEKQIPDTEAFEKEKKSVREKLLQQKKFKAFRTWLSQLRAQSEIKTFVN